MGSYYLYALVSLTANRTAENNIKNNCTHHSNTNILDARHFPDIRDLALMVLTVCRLCQLFAFLHSFYLAIKKAHPEECAKKVFSPVVATQTIHHWHGEMRETPFLQGMFPLANGNIRFVSQNHFITVLSKNKD